MNEKQTLQELVEQFMHLIRYTIFPFIHKLKDLYLSRVDLNAEDQSHLEKLKIILERYVVFEQRVINRIHRSQLERYLREEIRDLRSIAQDIDHMDIDGLEHDLEDLFCKLEAIYKKLQSL